MDKYEIEKLCKDGKTIDEIAKLSGKTYMQIYHTIKRYKYMFNKISTWYTDKDVAQIKKYLEEGKTYAEIASFYNKKDFNILNIAEKYGFKSKNHLQLNDEEKLQILDMHKKGFFLSEIEEEIGRGDTTISSYLASVGEKSRKKEIMDINKTLAESNQRRCGCCEKHLPRLEFFNNKTCKECSRKNARKNYAFKKEHPTLEIVAKVKIKSAKNRARQKKLSFSLTVEDFLQLYVVQNGNCFYSGLPLSLNIGTPNIISIDRLDSNLGYDINNCVLTTYIVNVMKNDSSVDDFLNMCKIITENNIKN